MAVPTPTVNRGPTTAFDIVYVSTKLQFKFSNEYLVIFNIQTRSATGQQPVYSSLISSMTTLMLSNHDWNIIDGVGLELALQESRKSYLEGGIPIGSVLLLPDRETSTGFVLLGAGHNERIQKQSPTLHGEISALENAGRQKPETYRNSVLVSSPGRLQPAMYHFV